MKYLVLFFTQILLVNWFPLTTYAQAKEKPAYNVKWGFVLPLTGGLARVGQDIRRGAEFAISDLAKNDVKHELYFEDSQYDKRSAVSAAQKLLSVNNVDVIVSLWETAEPIAPLADRFNKIHASIRWNSDTAEKFKNTFTFESTYQEYAKAFVALFKKQNFKKIALLGVDAVGWNLANQVFLSEANKFGLEITSSQTYLPGESDFKTYALRALKDKPDVILVDDAGDNINLVTKNIRSLNPSQRITGYLGYPMNLELFENEFFIAQLATDPSFEKRFEQRFNELVYVRAQLAYDLVTIIGTLYNKNLTKPSTEQIRDQLSTITEYQGASGRITTTNHGKVFQTEVKEMQVRNGKSVLVN
jgi:branched-chain amino acid transport system substrate-binding protein